MASHSAECLEDLGAGLGEGLIFLPLSCCCCSAGPCSCGWSLQPTLQMVAGQLPSEQLLMHHESEAMASLMLRHSESSIWCRVRVRVRVRVKAVIRVRVRLRLRLRVRN